MGLFRKAKVRRLGGFELVGAINTALLKIMQGARHEGYEEIESFIQGPFRELVTSILDSRLDEKGEHTEWENNNLLIKRD